MCVFYSGIQAGLYSASSLVRVGTCSSSFQGKLGNITTRASSFHHSCTCWSHFHPRSSSSSSISSFFHHKLHLLPFPCSHRTHRAMIDLPNAAVSLQVAKNSLWCKSWGQRRKERDRSIAKEKRKGKLSSSQSHIATYGVITASTITEYRTGSVALLHFSFKFFIFLV